MKTSVRISRRLFLGLTGGAIAGMSLPAGVAAIAGAPRANPAALRIQPARYRLREKLTENMVSVLPDAPPPVLRLKQGVPFSIDVTNMLPEASTMHWHGIRVPNKMDGVPYLTQWPIVQNETWHYSFTPKDAGTPIRIARPWSRWRVA
jgi:FtsP/CotA-like multicopper oxidase with cupredoxin domain